jgi:hypothetical protein
MTPIRIDRTLQSTILFSKMSACRLGSLRSLRVAKTRRYSVHAEHRLWRAREQREALSSSLPPSGVPLTLRRRAGPERSPDGVPRRRPANVRPPKRTGIPGRTRRPQVFPTNPVKVLAAPHPKRLSHHRLVTPGPRLALTTPDPSGRGNDGFAVSTDPRHIRVPSPAPPIHPLTRTSGTATTPLARDRFVPDPARRW